VYTNKNKKNLKGNPNAIIYGLQKYVISEKLFFGSLL